MADRRDLLLWTAVAAGPLAWFAQLTVGWALVPPAHHGGREILLVGLSSICLAIALAAAAIGWWRWRAMPSPPDGEPTLAGVRLLAVAVAVLGLGSALLVVCTALPIWMLGAGAEP